MSATTDHGGKDGAPADVADAKIEREIVSAERLHESDIFDLVREEVRLEDGTVVGRDFIDHPGAVAIVALRERAGEPDVLLVRQYRHPVRAMLWEVPAGLLDVAGEDPLAAARRELAEEADLRAERWDVLADYFTSPGGSNESLRIYLARDVAEIPEEERHTRVEEEAEMVARWVPLGHAVAAVHAGRIHNPSAVVGLLAAASAQRQGWQGLRAAGEPWMR